MNFFILGLPRSRTAWAANLLSHNGTICTHESMIEFNRAPFLHLRDHFKVLHETHSNVGVADTSLIHTPTLLTHHFPEARYAVMTNAKESWRRFAEKLGLRRQMIESVEDDYERTLETLPIEQTVFIDATQLTQNPEVARALQHHCTGNPDLHLQRYEMLKDMNIQAIPEKLRQRLQRQVL